VFGGSTAGGAYHPALSDYTIFVKRQANVFLGGPPLVKMATGEIVDAEDLGGAEMHATVTGLADQLAVDEYDHEFPRSHHCPGGHDSSADKHISHGIGLTPFERQENGS
jgi:hypothetical protein